VDLLLAVTSDSVAAVAAYRAAVAEALAGRPGAETAFDRALAADATLLVAQAGRAWTRWEKGRPATPVPPGRASRRERQHAEILGLVTGDRLVRAAALLAEHGAEFPADALPALAVAVGALRAGDRAVARLLRARLAGVGEGLVVVAAVAARAAGEDAEAGTLAAAALTGDPRNRRAADLLTGPRRSATHGDDVRHAAQAPHTQRERGPSA
jgi:hypothetical protein